MNYPITLTKVYKNIHIYVPSPELVKPHYENLLTITNSTPFPFWAKLWPSAIALTEFLQSNSNYIKNKKVLEMGAGIGLPSLSIALQTKEILISDYIPEAVTLIQKNIDYLQLKNAKATILDWNNVPETIFADTVLLSDVNYAPDDFESLLLLIHQFLNNKSTIIIATPQRIMASPFVKMLEPLVKVSEVKNIHYQGEWIAISILVLYA